MEGLVIMDPGAFWRDKRVLVTGHTGFKGAWLALWLRYLGAQVAGIALAPPTEPNLFDVLGLEGDMEHTLLDIRDFSRLSAAVGAFRPDVIFHLAAQPLVRDSYRDPVGTYATNVLGTVHVLEAVRQCPQARVLVNVTSDKCYYNREWLWGYREDERLGGHDPYSNSKACAELVTAAYRDSFFRPAEDDGRTPTAVATARAGNVIGGGDWARERVVPDIVRALTAGEPIVLRHPEAVRPWQHVLDPLHGYLMLAQALWTQPATYGGAWNFGPPDQEGRPVASLVRALLQGWGAPDHPIEVTTRPQPHEASQLRLDCTKAMRVLCWRPRLDFDEAIAWTVGWYRGHRAGADVRRLTLEQIAAYQAALE